LNSAVNVQLVGIKYKLIRVVHRIHTHSIKLMNLCWLWSYQETVIYQSSRFQHCGKVLVAT